MEINAYPPHIYVHIILVYRVVRAGVPMRIPPGARADTSPGTCDIQVTYTQRDRISYIAYIYIYSIV